MDVIVVGSGMSGLTASAELVRQGHRVVVVDKGRFPGGRMATRHDGGTRFDHGAQHFSARSDAFQRTVGQWVDDGRVAVWYEGHSVTRPERGYEPRYVAVGGMRSLMVQIAQTLDVRQSTEISAVAVDGDEVVAHTGDGELRAQAMVLTPPLPQTRALLDRSNIDLAAAQAAVLDAVVYEPSLTVMASLDGPSGLHDGHRASDGPVAWIADNQQKGVSALPSVTIQSSAVYAQRHLDADPSAWSRDLVSVAQEHIDGRITALTPHRWRYAQPRGTLDVGAMAIESDAPIVLAGEAFAGAKVEGAYLSGIAAAEAISAGG